MMNPSSRFDRPRPLRRLRAACALVGAWAFAAPGLAAHDASLAARSFAASGIETKAVRAATSDRIEHLPAHVQVPNAQQRYVATPVGGLVTELRAGVGDPVKKGQTLALVVSAELLALQRDLAQAGAERERTQRALERDERLLAEGLVAESRVETSRALDRQARAALAEKRSLLALSGVRPLAAGTFELVAPIDGVVLAQGANPGQRIDAATTLFRIAQLDPLELQIDVPIMAAPRVVLGAPVRVPQVGATGQVVAIGRAVGDAQTVSVRARLDAGLAALGPGQHVEAEIDARPGTGGERNWLVPASALVRLGAGGTSPAVFALRGDRYVVVPAVPLGEAGPDVVVQAALSEGEPVVSAGASQLKSALGANGEAGDPAATGASVPIAGRTDRPTPSVPISK